MSGLFVLFQVVKTTTCFFDIISKANYHKINCQAMIVGYFTNRNGERVPAPLVANMFEYGSSTRKYPKQPFFRQSFNKGEIEKAMLRVQEKYIKGD